MSNQIVGFMGAPSTGKTMLAGAMKEYAFTHGGVSTDVCTEYAREFVFKYGHPKHVYTQYRITSRQIEREDLLINGNSEFIFTDSPVWLGWIYAMLNLKPESDEEIHTAISDMYELFVMNQLHRYHKVYYVRADKTDDDGCRDMANQQLIEQLIDGFVTMHQHLLPIIKVPLRYNSPEDRKQFVWNDLLKEV
jgi:nicotinamide riboside kinase